MVNDTQDNQGLKWSIVTVGTTKGKKSNKNCGVEVLLSNLTVSVSLDYVFLVGNVHVQHWPHHAFLSLDLHGSQWWSDILVRVGGNFAARRVDTEVRQLCTNYLLLLSVRPSSRLVILCFCLRLADELPLKHLV